MRYVVEFIIVLILGAIAFQGTWIAWGPFW